MPHIRVSNLELNLIKAISKKLCNIIVENSKSPIKYFKVKVYNFFQITFIEFKGNLFYKNGIYY